MNPTRYAVIDEATNIVTNMTLWDGVTEWTPEPGQIAVPAPETADIGDVYDPETQTFSRP